MSDTKKYILDGYRFTDSETYEQARRELNKISEFKSDKDLTDEGELRQLYDLLVESEEFVTPVGVGFLREAQKRLVKNPDHRKTMKAIPVCREVKDETGSDSEAKNTVSAVEADIAAAEKDKEEQEKNAVLTSGFKLKIRNYRIVIAFMAVMILVPFGVLAYDKLYASKASQDAIVNEYAAWKEELTKKEQELNERERAFEEMADQSINSKTKAGEEENGESQNSGS